jgi:GDP-L-fucose synthase
MNLTVYTQYYRCKTADRQLEIDECLRRNLNHPGISKVMLFKQSNAPPLPQASVPLEVVESDERITYAEWFRWVQRQGSGIGLLLNADIVLDEGLKHLAATFNAPDSLLALTRYNPGHAGFHLNDYPHWTQDVWGVRTDAELPESLLYASSLPLGFPGCENRIATVMWSHGFRVRNPCYNVRCVHLQASTARHYDKSKDRLHGRVSYVHPSLAPDEDAELEFKLWTRSQQRPEVVRSAIRSHTSEREAQLDTHHHPRRAGGRDGGARHGRGPQGGNPGDEGLQRGGLEGEPTHQSPYGGAGARKPGLMAPAEDGLLIRPSDRIFVAGHRGMAGSAICRALQGKGDDHILTAKRQELDLEVAVAVRGWFEANRPEVVVLAAAKVGGIHANDTYPADFLLQNIKIQNNVIESAWRNGTKRLLFLGSSCIYPRDCPQPIKEEYLLTGPLKPTNEWYAIAKITGIKLCQALRIQYGFDAISLMATNLYGPGDNYHPTHSHVMAALIRRFQEAKEAVAPSVTCWGTGTPLREFLHADNLGEDCVHVLEHYSPDSSKRVQHLNVGTGVDLTIRELAELVASTVGYSGTIQWDSTKQDGTPKKQLDVSRITATGWQPQIHIRDGIQNAWMAFRAHTMDIP